MIVKILINYAHHSIDLQEEEFESRDFLVEQRGHFELVRYAFQSAECNFFWLENRKQESSHVIHPLAIFDFRIVVGISF